VVVVRALADAPTALPPDAVLVAPAMVPSLTPLLPSARALVTDHGGALSHAATLAREYGMPAVLGAAGATALADGTELWVDGDAGRVYVLDPARD
jgi:pyruvate,water dikinase